MHKTLFELVSDLADVLAGEKLEGSLAARERILLHPELVLDAGGANAELRKVVMLAPNLLRSYLQAVQADTSRTRWRTMLTAAEELLEDELGRLARLQRGVCEGEAA